MSSSPGAIVLRRGLRYIAGAAVLLATSVVPVTADGPTRHADWSEGMPVVEVNTFSHDGCPIESPDGRQLYIASTRPGGLLGNDIWVAERANKNAPWGPMQHLDPPVNSNSNDFCPTPLGDGWLLFVSDRPGHCGSTVNGDIYITRQRSDGTWTDPVHLGCYPNGPNFVGAEFGPSLVSSGRGTWLYFSSNGPDGVGDQDIYVSAMNPDGSFAAATPVGELNTAAEDTMPNVSRNGMEIVFASNRLGTEGATDIWAARWDPAARMWSDVTNLANINTPAPESRPSLSSDGRRLYFGRGAPPSDIFVSSRP